MAEGDKRDKRFPVESRQVTYLPAGKAPEVTRDAVPLDPELAKVREREIKANDVPSSAPLGVPTIDPELVKVRDTEIKRDAERARANRPAPVRTAAAEPAKKADAPKKSSK
jgi:hypothetical protein